ncbi:unnamed protein product [Mesocestoides corti]|uniref:Laminin EGF-like domain-containing protein n=1 Tax=Mesocestoides corti TaxID=53468 RepID=A0A0R3UL04_MESCO|nr:unnamed protein product [Mesocestoides corti]
MRHPHVLYLSKSISEGYRHACNRFSLSMQQPHDLVHVRHKHLPQVRRPIRRGLPRLRSEHRGGQLPGVHCRVHQTSRSLHFLIGCMSRLTLVAVVTSVFDVPVDVVVVVVVALERKSSRPQTSDAFTNLVLSTQNQPLHRMPLCVFTCVCVCVCVTTFSVLSSCVREACECNLHSNSCTFSQYFYLLSKKVSGGVCEDCRHHTTGEKCHQCMEGFYRDWTKPISHPMVCLSKSVVVVVEWV